VLLKLVETNSSVRDSQEKQVIHSAPESLIALQIEHDAMAEKFGPEHPKVKDLAKRIEKYQAFIDARRVEEDQINQMNRQKPDALLAQYMDMLRLELSKLDNFETKLNEMIDSMPKPQFALTPAAKAERLAAINVDLGNAERLECALIDAAQDEGTIIAHRPNTDPAALLGIVVARETAFAA